MILLNKALFSAQQFSVPLGRMLHFILVPDHYLSILFFKTCTKH